MTNMFAPSITFNNFCGEIVEAVREAAKTVPAFAASHNGCIRITAQPCCTEAANWINNNIVTGEPFMTERVYPIFPDGHTTIDSDTSEPVSCYAYSAMKTATAMIAAGVNTAIESHPIYDEDYFGKNFHEDCGYALHYGCIGRIISYREHKLERPFMELYVCVSGANQCEDRYCAEAGCTHADLIVNSKFLHYTTAQNGPTREGSYTFA